MVAAHRPPAGSLRALAVLLAGATLLIVGLFAALAWYQYRAQLRDAEIHARQNADLLAEHAASIFESSELILAQVDERVRGMSWQEIEASHELHDWLVRLAGLKKELGSIGLIDETGRGRQISLPFRSPTGGPDLSQRENFRVLSQRDVGLYVSRPVTMVSTGTRMFSISRRLSTPDGHFRGLVQVALPIDYFTGFWKELGPADQVVIPIIRADGEYVVRYPTVDVSARMPLSDPLLEAARRSEGGVFTRPSPIDGELRIDAFHKIGRYPLIIVYSQSMHSMLGHWRHDVAALATGGIAAVLGLLLLGGFAARQVRREDQAHRALAAAHARLGVEEERFRLLTENATDVIQRLAPDGTRLYVSPSVREVLGFSEEEMLERPPLHNVHPDDLPLLAEQQRQLATDGGTALSQFRMFKQDGSLVWLEAAGRAVRDPRTGAITELVSVARDVTRRKRTEEQLEAARREAEGAARAKSEFLATMSHEIRTPLTGVLGYNDLLLQSGLTPEQRHWSLAVRDAGQLLLSIINDVLDLSRAEAGQIELSPEPIALRPFAQGCLAMIAVAAERKGLAVAVETPEPLPAWVLGDKHRLEQALLNLLGNAVKFTERGGVTLAVSTVAGADGSPGRIRFEVRDTGVGIPVDRFDRLFKRFSQVDGSFARRFGGAGLGLAITKHLVSAMGGEIGVDSTPGAGSRFWFDVPLPETAAPAPAQPVAAADATRPLQVLLAEDIPANQMLISTILTRAGHRVEAVADGAEAAAAAARGDFDLILMDVQMPAMDGLAATRAIRALPGRRARVPILALTANALPEEAENCRVAGMDGHLTKPIDPRALLAAVSQMAGSQSPEGQSPASQSPDSQSPESPRAKALTGRPSTRRRARDSIR